MSQLLIQRARLFTAIAGEDTPPDSLHDIWVSDGRIQQIDASSSQPRDSARLRIVDAAERVLMPSFVDCHTHACWAGDRMDEWQRKLAGASYLELLEAGGGIMSTVRDVRRASESMLLQLLLPRLDRMLASGTTTIEVKSGYGLTTRDELKMLRAIAAANELWTGTVIPTACIGHALDPEVDRATFIRTTIDETLPAVTAEFPGIAIDAYCEEGAWSVDECQALFDAAQTAGHPIRVHTDQFHSLGMINTAMERGYRSVDHLEATDDALLEELAASECYAVMLPCSGFHLDDRYANGRILAKASGQLAIATNYNPGSAPCYSMQMAIALAVRKLGLSVDQALCAATSSPAALLGLKDRGTITTGQRADLVLLDTRDPAQLAFEFGGQNVQQVFVEGQRV